MTTFPLHIKALKYAQHCLGVHESPDGSNRGGIQVNNPFGGVTFFEQHDFLNGEGYPWCVDFAQTCWSVGANHPLPYLSAGAYNLFNWAKKVGWDEQVKLLVPGDIVIYKIGAGHAGVFEKLVQGGIGSIDGNWDNKVMRVTHPTKDVLGGIHIPEVHSPLPSPKPFWLVITSASGHKKIIFSQFATEKALLGFIPRWLAKYGKNGFTIKKGGVRK